MRRCFRWLQRLRAEEALQAATRVAVGTGSAGDEGSRVANQWKAIANPQEHAASEAAIVERRRQAITAAGVKVFGPKQQQPQT